MFTFSGFHNSATCAATRLSNPASTLRTCLRSPRAATEGFAGWDARGRPPARDTAAIALLLRGFARPARQRRRPPLTGRPQRHCPEGLERNRAISARCLLLAPPVQAASHRFELIPIALQRGGVEIINTFQNKLSPASTSQAGDQTPVWRCQHSKCALSDTSYR